MKIHLVGAELFHSGGHDKALPPPHNFVNTPKIACKNAAIRMCCQMNNAKSS